MILIVSNLEFHGVTTFISRLSKRLHHEGQKPAVLVIYGEGDKGMQDKIAQVADIYYLKDFFQYPRFPSVSHLNVFRKINIDKFQREIVNCYGSNVHVTGILGLALALGLHRGLSNLKISVGVYHQREFDYKYPFFDLFSTYILKCFSLMDSAQVLFFNEFNRAEYAKRFNSQWVNSRIVPIGIDVKSKEGIHFEQFEKGKIVSVGQLLPFKTYNEAIIRLMPSLLKEYSYLRYFIYGDGSERSRLEQMVAEKALDGKVIFCGTVRYEEFSSVVGDANVFIGSGTALLEAAALGVPSIVGIEGNQKADTYGFLSDIKGLSYNENIPGVPRREIQACLREVLAKNSQDRSKVGEACFVKAQQFSMEQTVRGLQESFDEISTKAISYSRMKAFIYFFVVALLDKLGIDRSYRNRRNQ